MLCDYPLKMRMDNGPELVSLALAQWAEEHGVMLEFIKPSKPTQNAFIERFNRTYRTEILDFYLFRTLNEAREITQRWLMEYNNERPHESLNNLTQEEYRLMGDLKKCMELKQVCLHKVVRAATAALCQKRILSDAESLVSPLEVFPVRQIIGLFTPPLERCRHYAKQNPTEEASEYRRGRLNAHTLPNGKPHSEPPYKTKSESHNKRYLPE